MIFLERQTGEVLCSEKGKRAVSGKKTVFEGSKVTNSNSGTRRQKK